MADKDHEAALAELLGEVGPLEDKNAGGNRSANGAEGVQVHTGEDDDVSVERELNLGPLDITSARVKDVFAALEEGGTAPPPHHAAIVRISYQYSTVPLYRNLSC